MKTLLLSCLMIPTLSQAYTINWNHFSDNGSFAVSNDFKTAGTGNLPPDSTQSIIGCTVNPNLIGRGFDVTCSGKQWRFKPHSQFSCAAGGGGIWTAPDGSTGAYLCG